MTALEGIFAEQGTVMGALQPASDVYFYGCKEADRVTEGGGTVEARDEWHELAG